jgi:hypothetical protein
MYVGDGGVTFRVPSLDLVRNMVIRASRVTVEGDQMSLNIWKISTVSSFGTYMRVREEYAIHQRETDNPRRGEEFGATRGRQEILGG